MKKLFIETMQGYIDIIENVEEVQILKLYGGKNYLKTLYNRDELGCCEFDERLLANVRLAYLVNLETMQEYFRYTK